MTAPPPPPQQTGCSPPPRPPSQPIRASSRLATSARRPHLAATTISDQRSAENMSNELAKVSNGSTNVALATTVSPWREAVNDEVGANFGTFLKFAKGDWTLGEEGKTVPAQARFVVCMVECYRGWVRWWDSKPTDHLIGRVVDRHRVPRREELGELDESKWETANNGARRDPWARTVYLAMRDVSSDEIICFTSSSDGGRKAVAKLLDYFDRNRHRFK